MARPTAAERRLDYLRIGADLVTGFGDAGSPAGPLEALANVKVSDVARHAGVTKGALYHLWDSQDDYRRDLLQHLLDQVEKEGLERAEQIIAEAVDDEGRPFIDVTDLAVHLSTGSYRDLRDDPRAQAQFSFYNYVHDPRVRRLLATGSSGFDSYYDLYLVTSGRRMREPYTVGHLITSVNAFMMGSVIRHRISRGSDTSADDAQIYATGFRALLLHFTEPLRDTEPLR
ncbi:MAG TPA: TetR family transcriptional regulator [Microthrixaceae bacterium]|nr:TetR family transcriptional regulator [Microthrixaceae bacterium]MCB9400857.1 TetR family transcriptional regulator [Microthrixaceae bacterium]MCO5307493.1 TetR/AcrR family transcriptional regulator [Microthrixaceae bacterium]HMU79498.1 TetR family transcriptional regulator [Microthrixaceae bacterium]HMV73252.1 TetR family transcriptional regulator [Microthrixaceae bacterium]